MRSILWLSLIAGLWLAGCDRRDVPVTTLPSEVVPATEEPIVPPPPVKAPPQLKLPAPLHKPQPPAPDQAAAVDGDQPGPGGDVAPPGDGAPPGDAPPEADAIFPFFLPKSRPRGCLGPLSGRPWTSVNATALHRSNTVRAAAEPV